MTTSRSADSEPREFDLEVVGEPDAHIVGPPRDIYEADELTGKRYPPL
jgi:hypothetical protein